MKNNPIKSLYSRLRSKLWFNVFLQVGLIFSVFILVLIISNLSFLSDFFFFKQEKQLVSQMRQLATLDLYDDSAVSAKLSEISDKYNFEAEIYNSGGKILYTTQGSQMLDYFFSGHTNFSMAHESMEVISSKKTEDGILIKTTQSRFGNNEFLICEKEIQSGIFAEVRIRKELIISAAQTANEFITIIASVCFVLSILWVFIFAHKFSKPISEMNIITKDMSRLKFDRKLRIKSSDEIGQLAFSVNEMSDSLSKALTELKESNAKLKDEIELERSLDVMRREFVANVSHELKTPLAIINGYAEGLKYNINAAAKDEYLNTIIDEGQRMNRLVMSILDLSRYESGQIPINPEVFDISLMAKEMLSRIFTDSNINTENALPEKLYAYADPLQTEQIIKSYLENAKAHTPNNGTVRIYSTETDEKTLRINIYNSGSFVEEAIMPQIWQSFYRGDTSHKREKSRFGLGLSIVEAICRLHGHSCGVQNTTDGVCFWFECDKAPVSTTEEPQNPQ